ncbi:pilus assembly protein PilP [Endozoicomonas sp. (ex Bugula neritina AB1)]|nr:pilus assembly protein PilP [Endozoicomonas sp. (ex Bugula neritina AB1)]
MALYLTGCGGQSGISDLDQYMNEVKSKPSGNIKPLPTFNPYEAFTYSASAIRSPFEPPVALSVNQREINSNVKPDTAREKELLEEFDIESISLVGSISNDEGFWGLVRSSQGVHRVKVGDYMGRDHGRIDYIQDGELRLIEIIPAGADLWVERPRSLVLEYQ